MFDIIYPLSIVAAIVATVLACIFILPEKKRESLNSIGKVLHDLVNFKVLIIEKILQVLYVFATALTICLGFFMLFTVKESYFSGTMWYGGYGILVMILGPICVRLAYEIIMMTILLVKNVIQINNKLKNQNEDTQNTSPFTTLDITNLITKSHDSEATSNENCPNCNSEVEQ